MNSSSMAPSDFDGVIDTVAIDQLNKRWCTPITVDAARRCDTAIGRGRLFGLI